MTKNIQAFWLVLGAFSIFCVGDIILNVLLDALPLLQVALYFSTTVFILIGFFIPFYGSYKPIIQTVNLKAQILRSMLGTICYFLVCYGFANIQMAEVYTLILTAPLWTAIAAHVFLKDRIVLHQWFAISVGFLGVVIVLQPGIIPVSLASLGVLFGAILFAGFNIVARFIGEEDKPITFVFYDVLTELPIFFLVILVLYGMEYFVSITYLQAFLFLLVSIVGLFGGMALAKGFSMGRSSTLGALQYTILITGGILAYLVFKEIPSLITFIGGGVIILSGLLLLRYEQKHKRDSIPT